MRNMWRSGTGISVRILLKYGFGMGIRKIVIVVFPFFSSHS